jgi:hypothetical protein
MIVGSSADAQLTAAAGKVDITPTRPVYIAGYSANRLSEGVHDPLWARCLVLKNGMESVAFVSCDLLGLTQPHIRKIRAGIRRIAGERVLIGCTHTHSGPDTYGQWGPKASQSGVDAEWLASTISRIAALVDETAANLKPAVLKYAKATGLKDLSYNARVKEILDADLAVMQVSSVDGKVISTLVNYACHPEVLNNKKLTSDFPHWLRTVVEDGGGGVAIYMNGAQGGMVTADIKNESSYPKGEAWPEAERIGRELGRAAIRVLADARPAQETTITFSQRQFLVPMENAGFKMLISAGILPKDMLEDGSVRTEVSRVTVGHAEFLTLPGEVLPNIGIYLKRNMSGDPKFLLGLTGDALGYILTPEDFGLNLYRYETSVSVGSLMGRLMEENLLALINADKNRGANKR